MIRVKRTSCSLTSADNLVMAKAGKRKTGPRKQRVGLDGACPARAAQFLLLGRYILIHRDSRSTRSYSHDTPLIIPFDRRALPVPLSAKLSSPSSPGTRPGSFACTPAASRAALSWTQPHRLSLFPAVVPTPDWPTARGV
ncbi:hypothetical protein L1887_62824 [Cichorium endivia]|nr:hypothetical protein L1887_62824 [Cichorium endivia]